MTGLRYIVHIIVLGKNIPVYRNKGFKRDTSSIMMIESMGIILENQYNIFLWDLDIMRHPSAGNFSCVTFFGNYTLYNEGLL